MLSELNKSNLRKEHQASKVEPRGMVCALGLLLVLITLGAYLNSFPAPFIFDDQNWIVHYRQIQQMPEDLGKLTVTDRPLIHLSIALNYAWGQLDVRGYHVFNLAVHVIAGLLLFGIVRRTILVTNARSPQNLPAAWLAFAVALLWLVHPLQTGSVTYVIQRCESMMGMFFLLCLYSMIRGSQAERGRPWYLVSIAACALGLGCKEVMITAPPVVLLYDRVFLATSWREAAQRRGWLHAILFSTALMMIVLMLPSILGGEEKNAGFGLADLTPLAYLQSQPAVILHYLRLAFWPRPLCLDYLWEPATSPARIYPAAAAVVALILASLLALRYRPWLGFAGTSFFVVLAPTSSMMPIADLAFEHRMYLPLASVVAIVVLVTYHLTQRSLRDPAVQRVARMVTLTLVATVLTILTWERNADYCDPVRMWSKVLDISPQNWRAHNALAEAFGERGELAKERYHYERALAAQPEHAKLHFSMAACLHRGGDADDAERHYRRALEIEPDYVEALFRYGALLGQKQAVDEAERCYRRILQIEPDHADAQRALAVLLWQAGRIGEAVAEYHRLLELRPNLPGVKAHLAKILATAEDPSVRDGQRAVQLAEEAYRALGDRDYRVFEALAAGYAELGRYDEACRAAQNAIVLAQRQGRTEAARQLQAWLDQYRDPQPTSKFADPVRSAVAVPSGQEI